MTLNSIGNLCLAATVAICAPAAVSGQTPAETRSGEGITVTGCLTARADGRSYALTPLKAAPMGEALRGAATDVKPTITYELLGKVEDFRNHAGRVVTARGRVDPEARKHVDVQAESKASPPAAGGAVKPQVKVEEEATIQVRRLTVERVTSEGKACPAAR